MKIYLDMVGCRLNQSEIEKFAFSARLAGHEIVEKAGDADIAIVNTCTVTAAAAADSRKVIRRIARAGCGHIVSTGCLSTVDPDQVWKLPAVQEIIDNEKKEELIEKVLSVVPEATELPYRREPLPGKHKRTRAFIKIQDGCDNHCTFCITHVARGKSRSILKGTVFADIERALKGGVKEIVLTGVNLGSWGKDFENQSTIAALVSSIISDLPVPRLRLSSIEPWDIDENLLRLLDHPAFCPHFHIPLQSGCDATLKRMGRKTSVKDFQLLIDQIRERNPAAAITTDIIVGFPGETDEEFEESLALIEALQLSGGHIFRYSPRKGTPAAVFENQVEEKVKKKRSKMLRDVIRKSEQAYRKKMLGMNAEVLWERSRKTGDRKYELSGLTETYIPVIAISSRDRYNEISIVKLLAHGQEKVRGEIVR